MSKYIITKVYDFSSGNEPRLGSLQYVHYRHKCDIDDIETV